MQSSGALSGRVALITGAAQRVGAHVARRLHGEGMDIILHYRSSEAAARELKDELDASRGESVLLLQADLNETAAFADLMDKVQAFRGRLDVLVNNASSYYATPLEEAGEEQWEDLMGSNLKGPFFLAKHAAPLLRASRGCVVNMVDIHAERPLKGYSIYCMAKAGNAMMVKSLARDLGPQVRVNGIAPGIALWPGQGLGEKTKEEILSRTALKRVGTPEDIARAIVFLVRDADYITGEIITVDGGRSLQQ